MKSVKNIRFLGNSMDTRNKGQFHSWKAIVFMVLFAIPIIFLLIQITLGQIITPIQPIGNVSTSNSSIFINTSIVFPNGEQPSNISHNWDGVNFPDYDPSLVLMMNMDNRSSIPCGNGFENASCVADLSQYGNNGTVVGGSNISMTVNGKYGGAVNFSGNKSYVVSSSLPLYNWSNGFTVHFWLQKYSNTGDFISTNFPPSAIFRMFNNGGSLVVRVYNSTGTEKEVVATGFTFTANTWFDADFVFNNTNMSIYVNGKFSNSGIITGGLNTTSLQVYVGSDGTSYEYLNGSVDDLKIWNRSLSASEVSQLYVTNLQRFNTTNWVLQTNQLLNATLNSTSPTYAWKDFVCAGNLTGSLVCSNTQTITQTIPVSTITANFTSSVGVINPNTFCVNIGDLNRFGGGTTIDINNDGVKEALSNVTWQRQTLLNSGIKCVRADLYVTGKYSNTTALNGVNFTGSYANQTLAMQWFYQNNINVYLIADYGLVQSYDNSSGKCINPGQGYCPPYNNTVYGNIIVDALNRTTNGGQYASAVAGVEVWNEPQGTSFLGGYSTDNISKASYYNSMYNATYLAIKAWNNNIKVGGMASLEESATLNNNMVNSFMGNFSNQSGFFSWHTYQDALNTTIINYTSAYNSLCSTYGFNCSNQIISELNSNQYAQQNGSQSSFVTKVLPAINYILNNNPSNLSYYLFEWTESTKWFNNPNVATYFGTYPYLYSMVSEPQLDNWLSSGFNITSNYAHLCPSGATVYQSSADNSQIQTTSAKSGNKYNAIGINTGTTSINLSVNLSGSYPYSNITDYQTGQVYPVVNGVAQLGIVDGYGIKYLTSGDLITPTISINSPTNLQSFVSSNPVLLSMTATDDIAIDTQTFYVTSNTYSSGIVKFNGATSIFLPDGNYQVQFCANDTSGNMACDTKVFSVYTPVGVISGGNGGTGGAGTINNTVVYANGTVVNYGNSTVLSYINLETSSPWFNGVRNNLNVKTFDTNNNLMDVNDLSLNSSYKNFSFKTVRLSNGEYNLNVFIDGVQNGTNVSFTVRANSASVSKSLSVQVVNPSTYEELRATVTNGVSEIIQNVKENAIMYTVLLVLFLIFLVIIVLAGRK